ncbi:MAG: ATP-binding cassette domain-containing protein [Acutalibacteraceae bacterium]
MLRLKNIVKTYVTGDIMQDALKGISITFRENEFVSILGQSGSGKTTMLNIIGGLDRYTSGDLIINGISTRQYNDSDWDYYRNHSIGFVFQSYNLIPHQSVLANVEMAMTLAGVSKKERREKAISVLKKVGLGDHIHKKPNQMSGGQMQRVAIARALVNNPDILLADEPTGALDSETSIQIMELLKEIAKDKLVIMVTHNPELAEKYSTRIVKLLDGEIVSDTNPYNEDEVQVQKIKHQKISMSFFTALSLSFNNLRTKKGRTILTAFAGSIGIIGIALVVALSAGLNDYISSVQKDTMSYYPITIGSESVDVSDVMGMRKQMAGKMRNQATEVSSNISGIYTDYQDSQSNNMISSNMKENNLTEFKKYLDNPESEIRQYVGENGIIYSYDLNFTVYSYDEDGNLINSTTEPEDNETKNGIGMLGGAMGMGNKIKSITSMLSGSSDSEFQNFSEMMRGSDGNAVSQLVADSYDVLYGSWPDSYDEVVLVLDGSNKISAQTLYQLGFITKEEYELNKEKIENGENAEELAFDYSDVNDHVFYLVTAGDHYIKNENGTFSYLDDSELNEEQLLKNAVKLKISGVVRPKAETENAVLSTAVAYTSMLTDYIISHTDESEVVKAQEADPKVNVLNGIEFEVPDDTKKVTDAKEYIKNLDAKEKSSVYTLIKYYEATDKKSDNANENGTDNAPDITNMSESEKAAAFDEWLKTADDEVLLALFESYLSGGSGIGSIQSSSVSESTTSANSERNTNSSSASGCSIFGKLIGSDSGNGSSNNTFFGRIRNKISGGSSGSSLFNSNSNTSVTLMNSLSDSAKVSLIREYAGKLSESEKASLYTIIINYNIDDADADTIKEISKLLSAGQSGGISAGISVDQNSVAVLLDNWLENTPDNEILIKIYDEYIGYSTYEDNMKDFGKVSYDAPASISIYTDSFDNKDAVALCIANYNETVNDDLKITYTDYISLLTSSITTIIDTVSYAIIAFVAISLVVSCIMIGIITHISVMERTKEIGILRALGASKRNISQVFNAETFIIGCCAGLLGIGISLLATVPMNIIIGKLSGIAGLSARLPVSSSVVLIVISIIITIIGGLLPAKKAAKKDPVIALRTE